MSNLEKDSAAAPAAPSGFHLPKGWRQYVARAYVEWRKHDQSTPDDVLDLMRDILYAAEEQVVTAPAAPEQDDIARLQAQLEKRHKSNFITSQALHNQIVGNQAAWIEWQHGAGAEAAMTWIHNGLAGPGLIPDGKEAQPWFDANVDDRYEIPPMKDGAMKTATNEGDASDE